jgi:predicted glycosyltransferase
MKVWYDACTGKHMRYGIAIAQRLRKAGHEVVLTTREHPDTLPLARTLGEKPIVVGKYAPSSLFSRLEESARRMLQFSEMFKGNLPALAIAHQSIELCRTAFGLGVPLVLTADTPHANAVNKLTIPLASVLVASEAIPKRLFKCYGQQNVVQFRGVDEVAWVKGSKPSKKLEHRKPLIMVRQMETQAAYALGKGDETLKLVEKLTLLGDVMFFSRYERTERKGLTVVNEFVDTATAVASADLVLSVGGTISREAALQGVPSIVITKLGHTYVNTYLANKGFPLFITKPSEVLSIARRYLGKRFDVKSKLAELENPVDTLERIIKEKQWT